MQKGDPNDVKGDPKFNFVSELFTKSMTIRTGLIDTDLLDIGGILCRGYKEGNPKLVCILLRRCVIHHLRVDLC